MSKIIGSLLFSLIRAAQPAEFTCAGFGPDDPINNNFAAQPRLMKTHE